MAGKDSLSPRGWRSGSMRGDSTCRVGGEALHEVVSFSPRVSTEVAARSQPDCFGGLLLREEGRADHGIGVTGIDAEQEGCRPRAGRAGECRGPPRNMTVPRIERPHARPAMVWVATALEARVLMGSTLVDERLNIGLGEDVAARAIE